MGGGARLISTTPPLERPFSRLFNVQIGGEDRRGKELRRGEEKVGVENKRAQQIYSKPREYIR